MDLETKAALTARIASLEEELKRVRKEEPQEAVQRPFKCSRRTRLISLAGEPCDYVESLASKMTVKELRTKIAEAKNIKVQRVQFCSKDGSAPLEDGVEIWHEASASGELCSRGEALRLLLQAETRITFTGTVKCLLNHCDEYNTHEREHWKNEWVELSVEEKDLGPDKSDQLRIFVGGKDLVRYGSLKNPHERQYETWGNKNAGSLELTVSKQPEYGPEVVTPEQPGPYEVGAQGLKVTTKEIGGAEQGTLRAGERVDVLEVKRPPNQRPFFRHHYGRILYKGVDGWIQLGPGKAIPAGIEKFPKVELTRHYAVEKGDCKYESCDETFIWFRTDADRDSFVLAFKSWEGNNPQVEEAPESESESE